jgi:hypothetical protein
MYSLNAQPHKQPGECVCVVFLFFEDKQTKQIDGKAAPEKTVELKITLCGKKKREKGGEHGPTGQRNLKQ